MWSPDCLHHVAGWWNDYDNQSGAFLRRVWAVRMAPKYPFSPRWIIERWFPPEHFGTREMWEQVTTEWSQTHGKVLELGPYPSEGMYTMIWKCEDLDGKYMDITPTLAQYCVQLALQPQPTLAELQNDARDRLAKRKAASRQAVIDEYDDAFPFLGRVNNLSAQPLLNKIRSQKKDGKEL